MRTRTLLAITALATAGLSTAPAFASEATGPGHCSVGSITGPIAAGHGGMSGIVHFLQTQPGGVAAFTSGGYLTSGVC